jgi:putative holliday junction resolvase
MGPDLLAHGGYPSGISQVGATYNRGVNQQVQPASSAVRVLGLDVGSKTIGMAVSDPLGVTAQGLNTVRRKSKRLDFSQLEAVIRQYQVGEIVVGYPLRMSGAEGSQAEKMQRFAQELRRRFGLPVHLWDERLTSAQANRVLREADLSIKRRGEVVDRLAAVLILQSWLDRRAG